MGKKNTEQNPESGGGGCIKKLVVMLLVVAMAYIGLHIYFLWLPLGKAGAFSKSLMDTNVAGVKVFPAIQLYDMDAITGRVEIIGGQPTSALLLKQRLKSAIERNYPISFREGEVNAWLGKRLDVSQGGLLAPFVKVRGVWVNFHQDELEIIIERELLKKHTHLTSLFMKFDNNKNGFSIHRNSSQIGQVRVPGGFARMIMPAFNNLTEELSDELQPYYDGKIHAIIVEKGKITIDPRIKKKQL